MSSETEDQSRRFDYEATEILSRYSGSELEEQASRWCERHAEMLSSAGFTLDDMGTKSRHSRNAKRILVVAAGTTPALAMLAPALSPLAESAHIPDCDALLLIAVLWSVRETQERYAETLRAWSIRRSAQSGLECSQDPAARLAYALRQFPELAYALLDGVVAFERECSNCRMSIGQVWTARIALDRLAKNRSAPDKVDLAALAKVDDSILLQDDVCRRSARELMAANRSPEKLTRVVEEGLAGADDENRYHALAILLASEKDQERAVAKLVEFWQRSPAGPYAYLVNGACQGSGWGRREVPKKILPFTRRLWTPPIKGINPAGPLHFLHRLIADEADENGWERVRECVGEFLLQLVLEPSTVTGVRLAALDALLALQPGGDGSIVRALGKVRGDPDVGDRAKEVQKHLKIVERTADGELAVQDAWMAFWRSARKEGGKS